MSVFGPNQVEELMIGSAVATEATVPDFIADADAGELQVVSAAGGAAEEGKPFKILQKTNGDAGKGLNYEFSDVVDPRKIERITVKEFSPEVLKQVTVEVSSVEENTTYILEVRILNDGGTLSPENFAIVSGYYLTGSNVTNVTEASIAEQLVENINGNLKRRGDSELSVSASGAVITIEGKPQRVVPGKIIGSQIEFEVNTKSFTKADPISENTQLITLPTIVQENNPGNGTGKYAVNLEWFTKGYKYEAHRQTGYPADFTERTPFYASQDKEYNVLHITYKNDRISPTLEEQPRVLTVFTAREDLAGNSNMNDVLAKIRTSVGSLANVPSDLAVD